MGTQLIMSIVFHPHMDGQSKRTRDKKIAEIGRFFGEKSDFGGPGKDFAVEKSDGKKSAKNRRFFR